MTLAMWIFHGVAGWYWFLLGAGGKNEGAMEVSLVFFWKALWLPFSQLVKLEVDYPGSQWIYKQSIHLVPTCGARWHLHRVSRRSRNRKGKSDIDTIPKFFCRIWTPWRKWLLGVLSRRTAHRISHWRKVVYWSEKWRDDSEEGCA